MRRALVVLVLLTSACRPEHGGSVPGAANASAPVAATAAGTSAPAPATAAALNSPVEGSVRAPLRARWIVRRESAGQAVLVARTERYVGMSLDVEVRITVPAGVTLEGEAARTIPASSGPVVSEQQVTLRFQGTPTGEAVLEATAGGTGFGITARDVYSFGRPRPERPHPHPRGRRLVVGGRDLGPSVPLAN